MISFLSAASPTVLFSVVDYFLFRLHVTKWHIFQIASSIFFSKEEITTVPALVIGGLTHITLEGLAGLVLFCALYYTGRKFYLFKGISVALLFWIMLFGGILSLKITAIAQPLGAPTNMTNLVEHILSGILAGFLMVKLADESVWD